MHFIRKPFKEIDNTTLYSILKLRSDVFVVEQDCVYPDLDNKDTLPDSIHVYSVTVPETDEAHLAAYARCLAPGVSYQGCSIGRVVVSPHDRGKGLATELMTEAITVCRTHWPSSPIQIGAQLYLEAFYASLGFRTFSEPYDEDGIMHVDMQLVVEAQ
ncbi:GNAT family N-acetyltransferase [Alteromonas facilis]|uniref:GNAT family N-acetyltransferase n=1 Tax=Alteromonas facilis TaxID=2048004 RepID=UPI000C2839E7|nr:GNAT family N-acetyltransferase [Alteromonas facilis]